MRRRLETIKYFLLSSFLVTVVPISHAQVGVGAVNDDGGVGVGAVNDGSGVGVGGINSSPSGGSATLSNPLKADSIVQLFQTLLDVLMVFAVPIIVFFIIFAGFKYVFARGNPGEIEVANRALLYAVIGGVLILGANIILTVIQGTVDQIGA